MCTLYPRTHARCPWPPRPGARRVGSVPPSVRKVAFSSDPRKGRAMSGSGLCCGVPSRVGSPDPTGCPPRPPDCPRAVGGVTERLCLCCSRFRLSRPAPPRSESEEESRGAELSSVTPVSLGAAGFVFRGVAAASGPSRAPPCSPFPWRGQCGCASTCACPLVQCRCGVASLSSSSPAAFPRLGTTGDLALFGAWGSGSGGNC